MERGPVGVPQVVFPLKMDCSTRCQQDCGLSKPITLPLACVSSFRPPTGVSRQGIHNRDQTLSWRPPIRDVRSETLRDQELLVDLRTEQLHPSKLQGRRTNATSTARGPHELTSLAVSASASVAANFSMLSLLRCPLPSAPQKHSWRQRTNSREQIDRRVSESCFHATLSQEAVINEFHPSHTTSHYCTSFQQN